MYVVWFYSSSCMIFTMSIFMRRMAFARLRSTGMCVKRDQINKWVKSINNICINKLHICICICFVDLLQYGFAPFVLKKDLVCPNLSKVSFHFTTSYPGQDSGWTVQEFSKNSWKTLYNNCQLHNAIDSLLIRPIKTVELFMVILPTNFTNIWTSKNNILENSVCMNQIQMFLSKQQNKECVTDSLLVSQWGSATFNNQHWMRVINSWLHHNECEKTKNDVKWPWMK